MTAIEQNTTPPRAESARHPEGAPSAPGGLRSRTPDVGDASPGAVAAPPSELIAIRREIDALDATLVDLVARRATLARSTAPVKAAGGLPLRDHRREADLVRRAAARARERGLDPEPVRSVFWTLVEISHAVTAARAPEGAAQASGEPRETPGHG